MKLNHDCVRDVLLTIEEELGLTDAVAAGKLATMGRLTTYELTDVIYTVITLRDHGFINSVGQDFTGPKGKIPKVRSLTFEGHNFLDNIRDIGVWQRVKTNVAKSISSVSIRALSDLANRVIQDEIGKLI